MDISLVLGICACVFSTISTIMGIISLVKVLAMEKSTHSVQYVPMEMMPDRHWADTDKKLEEINAVSKEEKEDLFGM